MTQLTLRLSRLLAIYAVIPLCTLAYAVDRGVLGGELRDALPRYPEQLFVYGLLFGWPHIVASNVILATNAEYRRAFRRPVIVASLVIVAFFVIGGIALPSIVLSVVVATATVVHVLKQQIGIGSRARGWIHVAWGWTGISAGIALYNSLYLEEDLARYAAVLDAASVALAATMLICAVLCHRRVTTALGRAFLWGNTVMVLAPVAFHRAGYDLFAIVIPRVIHDCTAFTFYVAHDYNKHRVAPSNALYRAAAWLPGGIYWLSPALAIALAFAIERYGDRAFDVLTAGALAGSFPQAMSVGLLGYLGMLHYYTESFTWKSGSPYRRYVSLEAT